MMWDRLKKLIAPFKTILDYWKVLTFILTALGLLGSLTGNYMQSQKLKADVPRGTIYKDRIVYKDRFIYKGCDSLINEHIDKEH